MNAEGLIAKLGVIQLFKDKIVYVHLMEEAEAPILMHVEFERYSFKFIFSFPLEQCCLCSLSKIILGIEVITYSSVCLDL